MNLPVLYDNALSQFSTEEAQRAWLWHKENRSNCSMGYDSDRFAREVDQIASVAGFAIDASQPEVRPDLMRFILGRHANWRLGGNIST